VTVKETGFKLASEVNQEVDKVMYIRMSNVWFSNRSRMVVE